MKALALLLALALPVRAEPPPVVPRVDLPRYMGTWHEIAKFPNRFQRGCTCTTATYALRPDGKVSVVNRCGTADGKGKQSRGWAKVADAATGAKLKVTFFWPFFGDYWILDLDPDYRRVLVGTPDRKYLWILAREPRLGEADYEALVAKARQLGFPVERLEKTPICP